MFKLQGIGNQSICSVEFDTNDIKSWHWIKSSPN